MAFVCILVVTVAAEDFVLYVSVLLAIQRIVTVEAAEVFLVPTPFLGFGVRAGKYQLKGGRGEGGRGGKRKRERERVEGKR